MLWKRERSVLLQGIVNMFYIKNVFNRFVHTFQKLGEYKFKGCTLFSTSLSYVCVKDCSGTIIDIIVKNIGHTYINEKNKKQRKMGPPQRPTLQIIVA